MTTFEGQDNACLEDSLQFARHIPQMPNIWCGLSAQDIEQIEHIFLRNLASGRAQRVWKRWLNPPAMFTHGTPLLNDHPMTDEHACWRFAYLQQIIQIYRQERVRLQALAERDDATWQQLGIQLTDSAYYLLVQKGLDARSATELARDMAQQTCYRIYVSPFPCDVAFDTWAHVILKNQILHQLMRSKELLDRQLYIESVEALQAEQEDRQTLTPLGQAYNAAFSSSSVMTKQIEDHDWLNSAIAQLPTLERRLVIVYTYFYELSDDEIAVQLGKSKGAIHTLRHRALKQLHLILKSEPTAKQQPKRHSLRKDDKQVKES
ncbi:MAG: RNA polymerase sigma factor [Caldilineaceae bacterium]|nr:RNA polymerase sigma factor [Caldilineaceae bacterium]